MEQDRSELHSGLSGNLIDAQNTFMFSCPYLGTLEDTDTSLSYPSPANHCFRTKTPASVELSHQGTYCLTDMHPGCHIFHQSISTSPAVKKRKKVANSERRTRRASVYALPLILILIFLAAILWWPAPGTTFQEAIAFGAQLRGSNDSAVSSDSQSESLAIDSPMSETDSQNLETNQQVGQSQDALAAAPESRDEIAGSALSEEEAAQSDAADRPQEQQTELAEESPPGAFQPAQGSAVQAEVQEIEAIDEENESIPSADNEEVETEPSVSVGESDPSAAAAIVDQEETVVEDATEAGAVENTETVKASDGEENDTLASLVYGLPVVDTLQSAPSAAVDQITESGGRAAFIGPDASTPLALREDNNDERSLFVRETPSLVGKLLTIINRRQQATILGRDSSSIWLKVRLESGVEGWVNATASKAAVDIDTLPVVDGVTAPTIQPQAASEVSELPVLRSAVVNTGALNMRSGPGVAYEPITILDRGEIVGLVGRFGTVWVKIRLDSGLEGWVNASLLAPLS